MRKYDTYFEDAISMGLYDEDALSSSEYWDVMSSQEDEPSSSYNPWEAIDASLDDPDGEQRRHEAWAETFMDMLGMSKEEVETLLS